jgi:hypothetical protein
MDVLIEHCEDPEGGGWDAELVAERIMLIAGAIGSRVSDPEQVDLVVSCDFVASVKSRVSTSEAAEYTTDRLFGEVGAKTIPGQSGGSTIVFPIDVALSLDPGLLGRLAEHEALHAAMRQRGETLSDLRQRSDLAEMSRDGIFAGLAGGAAEEYRVERALLDDGLFLTPSYADQVASTLPTLRDRLIARVALCKPGQPVDHCMQTVMAAFHQMTLLVAYAAAEDLASNGQLTPDRTATGWSRLVGDNYELYKDRLAAIPPASVSCARVALDETARRLDPVLENWLDDIGFFVEPQRVGIWFHVLRSGF